ncbi:hypothetical protein CT0861_00369, partial [Colletotrichum tofieldiae]
LKDTRETERERLQDPCQPRTGLWNSNPRLLSHPPPDNNHTSHNASQPQKVGQHVHVGKDGHCHRPLSVRQAPFDSHQAPDPPKAGQEPQGPGTRTPRLVGRSAGEFPSVLHDLRKTIRTPRHQLLILLRSLPQTRPAKRINRQESQPGAHGQLPLLRHRQPRAEGHRASRVTLAAELDALLPAHDARCHHHHQRRWPVLIRHLRVAVAQHPAPEPAIPHIVPPQPVALHQEQHQQPQHLVQPRHQQLLPGHLRRRVRGQRVRLQLQLQRHGPAATDAETHWAGLLEAEKHRVGDPHGRSLTLAGTVCEGSCTTARMVQSTHRHDDGIGEATDALRTASRPALCARRAGTTGPPRTRLSHPRPRPRG